MDDLGFYWGDMGWPTFLQAPADAPPSVRAVVPCFASTFENSHGTKYMGWGLSLATVEHGKGQYVLSTLNLIDNLGKHPAADRIVANILEHAGARK